MNTEDSAGSAKSVVDRACVNTEESAGYAKSVVDRACVDTDSRSAANTTQSVVTVGVNMGLVCVNTEKGFSDGESAIERL